MDHDTPAHRTPRVKICGVTSLDDAQLATELGAWAVGLIFYERSPRRCRATEAERIGAALKRSTLVTGVFVNETLERVLDLHDRVGFGMLQFHGDEGPAFCLEARRRTGVPVIRAAQVSAHAELQDLARYHTDFHLVDGRGTGAKANLRGGTGEGFDWGLIRDRHSDVPLIVSGGLRPGNVADAIAAMRPFAVDTASGTESAPGVKDPELVAAFFEAVAGTGAVAGAGAEAEPEAEAESESVPAK